MFEDVFRSYIYCAVAPFKCIRDMKLFQRLLVFQRGKYWITVNNGGKIKQTMFSIIERDQHLESIKTLCIDDF